MRFYYSTSSCDARIWSGRPRYPLSVHNRYPALLKTSNGILQFLRFDWLTGNGI